MFARVTRYEGSPDRIDEAARFVQEQLLPAARQMRGFKGGYWVVDRRTGRGFSMTLWESEEAMQATEAGADQLRSQAQDQAGTTIGSACSKLEASPATKQRCMPIPRWWLLP